MHARVTFAHVRPGVDQDEVIKIYRDSHMPELNQLEGYKSSLLLIERITGKIMVISLYEREAHIKLEDHRKLVNKLAHLTSTPPTQEVYEVAIQEIESRSGITYTRVAMGQTQDADKQDELIKIYRDSILLDLKQQPGYKGALVIVDRATGKVISFTLWESEADLKASEQRGYYQKQLAKLAHLLPALVVREVYEVAVHDLT